MTTAMMFILAGQLYGLPEGLQSAVCYVESHHNPAAMHKDDGNANSVGICQVQLPTAAMLGFKGTEKDLRNPLTNIFISADYLHRLISRYKGDLHKAVSAYNMGSWKTNLEGKTSNHAYVEKVIKARKEHR